MIKLYDMKIKDKIYCNDIYYIKNNLNIYIYVYIYYIYNILINQKINFANISK